MILISLLLIYFLPTEPRFEGNGIIFKLLSIISKEFEIQWVFVKYLYFFINVVFLFFLLNFFTKKIENSIFLIIFLIIFSLTGFTYQSYVDPIFFILLFSYFKLREEIKLTNIAYVYSFFVFYFSMLIFSILFRKYVYLA